MFYASQSFFQNTTFYIESQAWKFFVGYPFPFLFIKSFGKLHSSAKIAKFFYKKEERCASKI
jgi:hypothetical protein